MYFHLYRNYDTFAQPQKLAKLQEIYQQANRSKSHDYSPTIRFNVNYKLHDAEVFEIHFSFTDKHQTIIIQSTNVVVNLIYSPSVEKLLASSVLNRCKIDIDVITLIASSKQ